jgi:hypothetical protein
MARTTTKSTRQDKAAAEFNPYIDPSIAIEKLNKDLMDEARKLSDDEARFLVDYFYISQRNRIRFDGQVRAMNETGEPNQLLDWMGNAASVFERQIEKALDKYTDEHPVGRWIKKQHGFAAILAAGFLAYLDIEKAPSAGHFWAYAGFDPTREWNEGELRPWNPALKTLCYKAGDVQLKMSGFKNNYYGRLILERLSYEWERNFTPGSKAENDAIIARDGLSKKSKYGPTTEAWAWVNGCYKREDIRKLVMAGESVAAEAIKKLKLKPGEGDPMLPPAQMLGRARRYGMKIFLSHLHEVWYETHFKCRVPKPFVIEHLGHVHRIDVPHYDSPYANDQPAKIFHVLKHEGATEDAFFEDLNSLEVGERVLIARYAPEIQQMFIDNLVVGFVLVEKGNKKFAERTSEDLPRRKQ